MKYENTQIKHSIRVFYKTKADGTVVVVHSESTDFSVVNLEGTSAALWLQLVTPKKFSELLSWMCQEYDGEPATMEQDLVEFLDELFEKDLLEGKKL